MAGECRKGSGDGNLRATVVTETGWRRRAGTSFQAENTRSHDERHNIGMTHGRAPVMTMPCGLKGDITTDNT
jgi:hypothetical protein